eukprot:5946661-Prymnesium_polylepis.1
MGGRLNGMWATWPPAAFARRSLWRQSAEHAVRRRPSTRPRRRRACAAQGVALGGVSTAASLWAAVRRRCGGALRDPAAKFKAAAAHARRGESRRRTEPHACLAAAQDDRRGRRHQDHHLGPARPGRAHPEPGQGDPGGGAHVLVDDGPEARAAAEGRRDERGHVRLERARALAAANHTLRRSAPKPHQRLADGRTPRVARRRACVRIRSRTRG